MGSIGVHVGNLDRALICLNELRQEGFLAYHGARSCRWSAVVFTIKRGCYRGAEKVEKSRR